MGTGVATTTAAAGADWDAAEGRGAAAMLSDMPMGRECISMPASTSADVLAAVLARSGCGTRLKRHWGHDESCCSHRATHASWKR